MQNMVRTRMAPSPTGFLHVGTARTTLFNYLFACRHSGAFVLRIEDTDTERSRKEFEDDIIEHLTWLGLSWDEFYLQSERTALYKTYLEQLLREGKAFYCAHTKEELEAEHKKQVDAKESPRHICTHRNERRGEGIIRLKNDANGVVSFSDIIRGDISFNTELLGDFSLARTIETPLYNFSAVIDDSEMRITHVIRGEDHIPNTPKQILIQKAFGWEAPYYAHLPLLLGTDRSKLSKRHGATAMREYRAAGYLPEALINFLALLGWNPGDVQELFTLSELEKLFVLEKVQKGGAVFNIDKLKWLNGEYIRKMSPRELAQKIKPFIIEEGTSREYLEKVAALEQPRLKTLADIREHVFYFKDPEYDLELLRWKGRQEFSAILSNLEEVENILRDTSEESIMPFAEERGKGEVLWPLRVALSGLTASPDPIEILSVIGKDAGLRRIERAKKLIANVKLKNQNAK